MQINTNSWHYKVMNFCHNALHGETMWSSDRPKSLCTYFWSFWIKLFAFLFQYSVITTIVLGLPISAWSGFMNHSNKAMALFTIYGVIISFVVFILLLGQFKRYLRKRSHHASRSTKVNKGLSLLGTGIEYFKALKNKACPTIQYFNDK